MGIDKLIFTVPDFCAAHSISRAKLYELWRAGQGPDRFKVGARTMISAEGAARWRKVIENANATPAQCKKTNNEK